MRENLRTPRLSATHNHRHTRPGKSHDHHHTAPPKHAPCPTPAPASDAPSIATSTSSTPPSPTPSTSSRPACAPSTTSSTPRACSQTPATPRTRCATWPPPAPPPRSSPQAAILDPELAIATREFCRHAPAELALQAADALGARLESRAGEAAPDALEEWLDTLTHLDATSRLAPARLAALLAFARHRLEHEDDDRLLYSLVPHLSFDTAHALAAMSGDAWREVHLCLAERFPHLPVATMPSPDPMLVLLQHRRDRRAMLLERLAQAMAWAVPRRFVETSRALLEHAGVPPSTLERILATTLDDDDYALPDGAPARLSRSQREAAWRTALDELVPDEWPTAWWWVALAWDEGGCELVRGLFEVLAELRQE